MIRIICVLLIVTLGLAIGGGNEATVETVVELPPVGAMVEMSVLAPKTLEDEWVAPIVVAEPCIGMEQAAAPEPVAVFEAAEAVVEEADPFAEYWDNFVDEFIPDEYWDNFVEVLIPDEYWDNFVDEFIPDEYWDSIEP